MKWLRVFMLFSFLFTLSSPVSATAGSPQVPAEPIAAQLEQAAYSLITQQFALDPSVTDAISTRATQVEATSARIDVQVKTSFDVDEVIDDVVHVYAIHDGQQLLHVFREPGDDFYRYADDVSPDLLPAERLAMWRQLRSEEQGSRSTASLNSLYKLPFDGGKRYLVYQDYDKHYDFQLPVGTTVRAARGGAAHVGYEPNGGYFVRILHSDGSYGFYVHLQENSFMVSEGQSVGQGGCLAFSGNTGILSNGAHLHFNVNASIYNVGGDPFGDAYTAVSFTEGPAPWGQYTPASQNLSGACSAVPPYGWIDSPAANSSISYITRIMGWAAVQGSSINRVEIWVDGVKKGNAVYGQSRPDAGGNFGFYYDLDTRPIGNGSHTLQAIAVAESGGSSPLLSTSAQPSLDVSINNDTSQVVVYVEEPTLHPAYGNGICDSAWFQYTNNRNHPAFLTMNTNNADQSTNWAEWSANLPRPGVYQVDVYIPTHDPMTWQCPTIYNVNWDTSSARYQVYFANGASADATIDQAPVFNDWRTLGNYYFNAGTGGKVELHDLTGDANLSRTVSFSAVRFTLVSTEEPPATISDLRVEPGPTSLSWNVSWTAPGANGMSGGAAAGYDLRYSTSPITEANWASASQAASEPVPASPGTRQSMITARKNPGQRYYFAMKAVDQTGTWSSVPADQPSLVDIGFRSLYNGYSFPNYTGSAHPFPFEVTATDLNILFGDSVCWDPYCLTIKPSVAKWLVKANRELMGHGHCEGITVSSLLFFKGYDTPSKYQSGAASISDLSLKHYAVVNKIAFEQMKQYTRELYNIKSNSMSESTPASVIPQLLTALSGNVPAANLVIDKGHSSHALLPYSVEQVANQKWKVWVYDSNRPYGRYENYVDIDTAQGTWSYDMGPKNGVWQGNKSSHTIYLVPLSSYINYHATWDPSVLEILTKNSGSTVANILVTNSKGQNIGYYRNEFINEIPGAQVFSAAGDPWDSTALSYYLPLGETYKVTVDGQTITQTESISITQVGPGYVLSSDSLSLSPEKKVTLLVRADGSSYALKGDEPQQPSVQLAFDESDKGYTFDIKGIVVTAGQEIQLAPDKTNHRLILKGGKPASGTYDLKFSMTDSASEKRYLHAGLQLLPTDTYSINYGGWDGYGSVTLEIDHDGDGVIDDEMVLLNDLTAKSIYLPTIRK